MSGLHRTYIGQIERGEKNISFANLLKVSGVLGVTMSELLTGLEEGTWPESDRVRRASNSKAAESAHPLFEVHRLIKRLKLQRSAMDRTVELLEQRALDAGGPRAGRAAVKRTRRKQNQTRGARGFRTLGLPGTSPPRSWRFSWALRRRPSRIHPRSSRCCRTSRISDIVQARVSRTASPTAFNGAHPRNQSSCSTRSSSVRICSKPRLMVPSDS